MASLTKLIRGASTRARAKRVAMFRRHFDLDSSTRLLDLGSEDGTHVEQTVRGTSVRPENVYIADIDPGAVARGHHRFGYQPVVIDESGRLPYPDRYFDIVLCSSVIEHVTVPKRDIWQVRSGRQFKRIATERQREFALEIARVGARYFVQTPNRGFLIESHSWLPLLGILPRRWLLPTLRLSNAVWIKRTAPDWNLLDEQGLRELFPEAEILHERFLGMTKSVIAVRRATWTPPLPQRAGQRPRGPGGRGR